MMSLPPKIVKGSSSSMDQKFIPSEILINILSRLPVKSIIRCKCVCKSWLELLETSEFAKDHLSKSIPGLVVYNDVVKIFDFNDELELEHHCLHYNLVIEFHKTTLSSTPAHDVMEIGGSADGLVLLCGKNHHPNALYVCNPITREYIELPCLDLHQNYESVGDGFGVSMTSGHYKVVKILQELVFDDIRLPRTLKSECWIYTLGTRAWRRCIVPCPFYEYNGGNAFLNGNLHWSIEDLNDGSYLISCFDLETEVFSTFSPPPLLGVPLFRSDPVVFEDCLCICDNSTESGNELIVIWLMKEYGNEKSWMKQFVFPKHPDLASQPLECMYPLKLFEDGDILLLWGALFLFYYSKKTNTAQKLDLFGLHEYEFLEARPHVLSFLSLKNLAVETVRKF